MYSINKKNLKLYVVSCHADKPLSEKIPVSKYEIPIQAGAALTEIRNTEINDHDAFEESISDRNERYSELTAMYWIYRHPDDTPYIGISHYRRRLNLSDLEYEKYIEDGVDIITSEKFNLGASIKDNYCKLHYSSDWKLFMEILEEKDAADFEFDNEVFDSELIHVGNINVFRKDLYIEYCDWAFPILDEFYRRSPSKTDIYQNRDVGFIAERLSHLFIMKMEREGKKIIEAAIKQYGSTEWLVKEACDYSNPENVLEVCNELYKKRKIKQATAVIMYSISQGCARNEAVKKLSIILGTAYMEKDELAETLHEYLPANLRADLNTLIFIWNALEKAIETRLRVNDEAAQAVFADFLELTHFSEIAVTNATQFLTNPNAEIRVTF